MYSVKIESIADCSDVKLSDIELIRSNLESRLGKRGITFTRVAPFLGQPNFFVLSSFSRTGKDRKMRFDDWIIVNETINGILDDMGIVAYVRNAKYSIRSPERNV